MNHTPGPWKFEPRSSTPTHEITAGDSRVRPACVIAWVNKGRPEVESNAALIAAAPELLAACADVLRRFGSSDDGLSESEMAAIQRVRAAIAKARGES